MRTFLALGGLVLLAPPALGQEGLVDHGDGTLTDAGRGIMWQKQDDHLERSWKEAARYCEALELAGHKDWRLPPISLLETVLDPERSPAVVAGFAVKPAYYWSASEIRGDEKSAQCVHFGYGNTYAFGKESAYSVLCVRDASTAEPLTATFGASPGDGEAPLAVRFAPEVSGGALPYFYEWDFRDGETSSIAHPVHVYQESGTYEVALTISDSAGAIVSASQAVTVPVEAAAAAVEPKESQSPQTPAEFGGGPTAGGQGDPGPGGEGGPTATVSSGVPASYLEVILDRQRRAGGAIRIGYLAHAFANGMKGDADWNKDGAVTTSELRNYLSMAVASLSSGQEQAAARLAGEDAAVCAPVGRTYAVLLGVSSHADPAYAASPQARESVEMVKDAIAGQCGGESVLFVVAAELADREGLMKVLEILATEVGTQDTVLFYHSGLAAGGPEARSLLLLDTRRPMERLTSLSRADLLAFLGGLPARQTIVFMETDLVP